MTDTVTITEQALKWINIKPLIKDGDPHALHEGLRRLSGTHPSKIFDSVNELWNDPTKNALIDTLLRWGTPKHKLKLFTYLLKTSERDRLSEVEGGDVNDGDNDDEDDADSSRTVNVIPIALRLLRVSGDLDNLLLEEPSERGLNVLQLIVELGSDDLLAAIIQLAKEGRVQDIEKLLHISSEWKESPMLLIVELNKFEMLQLLLSSLPNLIPDEDIIERTIESEKKAIEKRKRAIESQNHKNEKNTEKKHLSLLLLFAKHRPQCTTVSFLKSAISLASVEILEEVLKHRSSMFTGHGLLSDAVESGRVKVIEMLIKGCPQLAIELDAQGNPALSRLENIDNLTAREKVRSVVVPSILRRTQSELLESYSGKDRKTVIEIIRVLLAEPKDQRKEISLDLGGFRSSSRSIEPFLQMIRKSSNSKGTNTPQTVGLKVEFESTLRYVDIPIPDFPEAEPERATGTERSEARTVFEWLRNQKKVSGIYELRVRDSVFYPHNEQVIAQCLDGFDVEILDWMRVDMSVKPLLATCTKLKRLVLYASNWATLSYWTSEEVVKVLSTFKNDLIGPAFGAKYLTEAKGRLEAIEFGERSLGDLKPRRFYMEFRLRSWYSIRQRKEDTPVLKKTTAAEVTQLGSFIKSYRVLQKEVEDEEYLEEIGAKLRETPCIRVAVVDTGVDPDSIECKQISGASFVPSDSGESPWWFSYHPHGTQMARLISDLDPHCKILVAKVGDAQMDMTVERLIQALKWAVDSKADIISLSAAFFKDNATLRLEIQRAIKAGVVIIASTAGEGYLQEEAYPAKYDGVIKIAATDLRGKETPESLAELADYMFPGDGILAETTFLGMSNPSNKISGTSVATAIASGVASLVLACHRLALSTQELEEPWTNHRELKRDIVRRVFDSMVENKEAKFVKPWLFFNEADQENWGEASRTLKWLGKKNF
ncbi:hypothetical protein ACHAPU_007886 [Fusarium lateritium]